MVSRIFTDKKDDDNRHVKSELYKSTLAQHPNYDDQSDICFEALKNHQAKHAHQLHNIKTNSDETREIVNVITQDAVCAENEKNESQIPNSEKIADVIARWTGTWTFITLFILCMVAWVVVNVYHLTVEFDPFPYEVLNLLLSMIAAIQAIIILMSQNRQERRNRKRDEDTFKTNLKAELEIKLLHEKVDYLISQLSSKNV